MFILTDGEFARQLKDQNMSMEAVREEAKKDLAINSLQDKYAGKITISDREVEDYFNSNKQQFVNNRGVALAMIAVDPADNTLWMGSQNAQGSFYQYSKSGTALGSVFYPALASQNTLGGEFQQFATGKYLEVNGQGKFNGPAGKPALFAFSDVENQPVPGTIYVEGVLAYQDKGSKTSFQTGKIFSVMASGNEAVIRGNAHINKKTLVDFTIYVIGNQNPPTNDFYSISLSNGYSASGYLTNGFITITLSD